MKKFYFMGGLPRSGSTLLTTILNQNPNIFASHHTELLTAMFEQVQRTHSYEPFRLGLHEENYFDLVRLMPESFYSRISQPVIIDKNRRWGTPYSLAIANYFTNKPKFIMMVRPLLDVLASFIRLARRNPENYIDRAMKSEDFLPSHYLPIDDARCEWLLKPNGQIDASLLALATLNKPENRDKVHVVNYDDLISQPKHVLNQIYQFLQLELFDHNFIDIEVYENAKDQEILGMSGLHQTRSQIEKISPKADTILSSYILEKYSTALAPLGIRPE